MIPSLKPSEVRLEMAGIEFVLIDAGKRLRQRRLELRWNEAPFLATKAR